MVIAFDDLKFQAVTAPRNPNRAAKNGVRPAIVWPRGERQAAVPERVEITPGLTRAFGAIEVDVAFERTDAVRINQHRGDATDLSSILEIISPKGQTESARESAKVRVAEKTSGNRMKNGAMRYKIAPSAGRSAHANSKVQP